MKHIQIKPNRLKTRRNTKKGKGKGKKKSTTKRKTKRRGGVSKIRRRRKGGDEKPLDPAALKIINRKFDDRVIEENQNKVDTLDEKEQQLDEKEKQLEEREQQLEEKMRELEKEEEEPEKQEKVRTRKGTKGTNNKQKVKVIVNVSTTKEGKVYVTVHEKSKSILQEVEDVENALRIWMDNNNPPPKPAENETIKIIYDKVTGEIKYDDDSEEDE